MMRVRESDGAVAEAVREMYAAYPDADRFDEHLHHEVTIWESDQPGPWLGLPELQQLRNRRPAEQDNRPVLTVVDLLVDRWGDEAAVARYLLHATIADDEVVFRVTDVWDHCGRWRIVHHHAEHV